MKYVEILVKKTQEGNAQAQVDCYGLSKCVTTFEDFVSFLPKTTKSFVKISDED